MTPTTPPPRIGDSAPRISPPDALPSFVLDESDATLLAFLLSDSDRLDGWRAWQQSIAIEDVAGTTHELLPALYKRLEAMGYDGPEMGRLRGIYRHRWTGNQRHRTAATAAMEALATARVVHLASWDLAAADALQEPGVLPLQTPRIAIPYERTGAAIEALQAEGWTIADGGHVRQPLRARLVQTEWQFDHRAGHSVVLANHYNRRLRDRQAERDVWRRSTAVEGSARRVDPSDLLLAALTDAIAHAPALRWAIAAYHLAPALEAATGGAIELERQLGTRAARYLLKPLEVRLAHLDSLAPGQGTIVRALEVTRSELAKPDPRRAPHGGLRRALELPPHLAAASVRVIGRFGGPRGTWRYLRSTR